MKGFSCYRCGGSLEQLTPPLARLDACPACGVHLHVCRMCRHYAPNAPDQCTEDDAIEVRDKASANFCDYFDPNPDAFDGAEQAADRRAREALATLFDDGAGPPPPKAGPAGSSGDAGSADDSALDAANALFKK